MEKLKYQTDRSWVEINLDALENNVQEISKLLRSRKQIMAVVKADAYGHGAIKISQELEKLGIDCFAVATIDEAMILRQNHIHGDILILGFTAPHLAPLLLKYHLIQTVIDYDYGQQLNSMQMPLQIHIKIDSGMHRLGADYHDLTHIRRLFELPYLHVEGVFSHLCVADSSKMEDIHFTKQQFLNFNQTIHQLQEFGYDVGKVHIQSSYGLLNYPDYHYDYARMGIALYGVQSSTDDYMKNHLNLQPVLSIQSHIACLHHYPAGSSLGYGRTYTLEKDSLIAVVPLGYADGLPRQLSQNQDVLVRGKKIPIVGRICMDQLMIDVTSLKDVQLNDIVTFIGHNHQQTIGIEELAKNAHTISNEILSRIGQRLPKVYIKKGNIINENTQTFLL